ncbi:MAG: NUDIX hydrolase [Halopenitus sp.]
MTPAPSSETDPSSVPESIRDPESLRATEGVPVEADADVVDADALEQIADLPDLAAVGLTNDRGEVLLRKFTPDSSWKLPCQAVEPDEDFVAAAETTLAEQVGPDAALATVTCCWSLEAHTADGERSTTRHFVVFRATPTADDPAMSATSPGGEAVADAGWFEQPPADATQLPGTERFFE